MTFFAEMAARFTGPLSFRFILQPAVALLMGVRDGRRDAREGKPPFVFDLLVHPQARTQRLLTAARSTLIAIVVGIVADALAQYLMFRAVRPFQALLVGTLIIALPYAAARGGANRIVCALPRQRRGGPRHAG